MSGKDSLNSSGDSGSGGTGQAFHEENRHKALSDALKSSFFIIRIGMIVVMAVILGSGVLMVEQNQVAILLRFGKPVVSGTEMLLRPGLHFAFPDPIDEKILVNVGESMSVRSSVGWYDNDPDREVRGLPPAPKGFLSPLQDGYLISADGNIFHAQATMKYRITDPLKYALDFGSVTNVLQDLLDNALIHAAARFTAQQAIYKNQTAFKEAITAELNQSVKEYNLGITMDPLDLEVRPPVDVQESFELVQARDQERSQKINQARAYASQVTLRASGEAEAIRLRGISSSNEVVRLLASDAEFFSGQLESYRSNPSLFRRRMLSQTLVPLLTNAQDVFFVPSPRAGETGQLNLQINPEPPKSRASTRSQ